MNVSNLEQSVAFYDKILKKLDWSKKIVEDHIVGYTYQGTWLFLEQIKEDFKKNGFHRKHVGLNHLAFSVDSKKEVDNFYEFLKENEIKVLYTGPKEYPQYCEDYYAVYFEDPDRIKLEIVHIPQ
ncbi:VOC family protein [Patescibacteria group bacterium]|nr:VOC family protein [Patescibacteria group bacterium]